MTNRMIWPLEESYESWAERMARNGEFVDVIFFQALALTLSTDVVFIPVFGESACVNGMFTLIKGADIRNLLHFFLDILKKEDFSVVIFNLLCQILKFWRIQS